VILKLRGTCSRGTSSRIGTLPTFHIVTNTLDCPYDISIELECELKERFSEKKLEKMTSRYSNLRVSSRAKCKESTKFQKAIGLTL